MAVIVQNLFPYDNGMPRMRKGLSLLNEEMLRPLAIGSDWNALRISLLIRIQDIGVTLNAFRLAVGVCSGNTYGAGSSNCRHWLGATIGDAVSASGGSYNIGGGYPFYGVMGRSAGKKIGSTWTVTNSGIGTVFVLAGGGLVPYRSQYFGFNVKKKITGQDRCTVILQSTAI